MRKDESRRPIALGSWTLACVAIVSCTDEDPAPRSAASNPEPTPTAAPTASPPAGAVVIDGVPAGDPAAFNAWLQTRSYETWPKESAPRAFTPGAGGHSGEVRTYVNPTLDASLRSGAEEHPRGSASVKEFYRNGALTGWAAYVKTQERSDGGRGFYWYEVFDVAPGATAIGGQGSATCTGCHASGKDFVRTPYPLR